MYKDIECPYCEHPQDVNHDDGYGYAEDVVHNMACENCGKNFVYTTSITFNYTPDKADCLNGGDHVWSKTIVYPKRYTKMRCTQCDDEREPTKEERLEYKLDDESE